MPYLPTEIPNSSIEIYKQYLEIVEKINQYTKQKSLTEEKKAFVKDLKQYRNKIQRKFKGLYIGSAKERRQQRKLINRRLREAQAVVTLIEAAEFSADSDEEKELTPLQETVKETQESLQNLRVSSPVMNLTDSEDEK